MLEDLEPRLLAAETVESIVPDENPITDDAGWSTLPAPSIEEVPTMVNSTPIHPSTSPPLEDERATLEAELARIDAAWGHRDTGAVPLTSAKDVALSDLESRLSELEF